MSFFTTYHDVVLQAIETAAALNEASINEGAKLMADATQNGHTLYTFGTGHSHMIGQDVYARAGGYAKIYPIVEIEMTLATHPTKSTHVERTAAYADVLDVLYHIEDGDIIIVTSNSGRNPLVIEYTMRAKAKGAKIIAITSLTHSKTIESRHECGKRLFELADVVLDNVAPYGDAGVDIDKDTRMGPISTLTGCYLAQSLMGCFVEEVKQRGVDAPVFKSSNMDGADAYNQKLFDAYVIKK